MSPEKSGFWGAEPVTQPGGPKPEGHGFADLGGGAAWGLQGRWETLWGRRSSPFRSPPTPVTV